MSRSPTGETLSSRCLRGLSKAFEASLSSLRTSLLARHLEVGVVEHRVVHKVLPPHNRQHHLNPPPPPPPAECRIRSSRPVRQSRAGPPRSFPAAETRMRTRAFRSAVPAATAPRAPFALKILVTSPPPHPHAPDTAAAAAAAAAARGTPQGRTYPSPT